jgi:hypothetical protein
MSKGIAEIEEIVMRLESYFLEGDARLEQVEKLRSVTDRFARSSSGSWLGYQSRVYYRDFQTPKAGHNFSSEWGRDSFHGEGTVGDWIEYTYEAVIDAMEVEAGSPDLASPDEYRKRGIQLFENAQQETEIFLRLSLQLRPDSFIENCWRKSYKRLFFLNRC